MATRTSAQPNQQGDINKAYTNGNTNGNVAHHDHYDGSTTTGSLPDNTQGQRVQRYDYGGNPLVHAHTGESARLAAFGGEFQPGLYKPTEGRKFANPAPLGLSAFALTTFVLSLINIGVRGVTVPSIVTGLAFGYGGLVQLLAGMWEMAVGNTFGATALASYGGFWISFAVILTPGGFQVGEAYADGPVNSESYALGFYLAGWFIFTTILLLCTLRSTVAFFLLFFFLDMAFMFLMLAHLYPEKGEAKVSLNKAGGYFGLFAAFMAWYNALAGIADSSNSFFLIPVAHFPWSEKGRERKMKTEDRTV